MWRDADQSSAAFVEQSARNPGVHRARPSMTMIIMKSHAARRAWVGACIAATALIGCGGGPDTGARTAAPPGASSEHSTASRGPTIIAKPNPVPAGRGVGTTTISWTTADVGPGEIYVAVGDEPEKLFASGVSGSQQAPWIGPGARYLFRLYRSGDRSKPLAAVEVINGGNAAVPRSRAWIEATPNPVPASTGFGKTSIRWATGDGSVGQIYVASAGIPEQLFTQGSTGATDAPWIGNGDYQFSLYAGKDHRVALATVLVKRQSPTGR